MNRPNEQLERLISRILDEEATAGERRELNSRLRHDPQAAALFEEERALDREFKVALHHAMGHAIVKRHPRPVWERTARNLVLAAAACLTLLFWSTPTRQTTPADLQTASQSWFQAPSLGTDTLTTDPAALEPAVTPQRDTNADWIVIPSDTPGEFLVIEVNRVKTRMVINQRDF